MFTYTIYRTYGIGEDAIDEAVATFATLKEAIQAMSKYTGRLYVSRTWGGEA